MSKRIIKASKEGKIFEKALKEAFRKKLKEKGIKVYPALLMEKTIEIPTENEVEEVLKRLGFLAGEAFYEEIKDWIEGEEIEITRWFGEEEKTATYKNADVLLEIPSRKRVIIAEITLKGAGEEIRKLLSKKDQTGWVLKGTRETGLFVPVMVKTLSDYLDFLLPIYINRGLAPTPFIETTTKFFQILFYLADYIENNPSTEEVYLRLLYPLKWGLGFKIPVGDAERVIKWKNELWNLYKLGKSLSGYEEFEFESSYEVVVPRRSISEVRKRLREKVLKHTARKEGKVLFLLHGAGSGKTTSILEAVKRKEKAFLIFLSPRYELLLDKEEKLEGFEILKPAEGENRKNFWTYSGKKKAVPQKGNLLRIFEAMKEYTTIPEKVALFTTVQSLVDIYTGKWTGEHLVKMVQLYLKHHPNGEVFIVFDELTGAEKSIHQMLKVAYALKRKSEKNYGKVHLIGLDANLHSPKVAKNLIEFVISSPRTVIPSSFFPLKRGEINSEEEIKTGKIPTFFGKEVVILTDFSYPAKSVGIKTRQANGFEELAEGIGEESEGEQIFVYAQDIKLLEEIKEFLEKKGKKTALITSVKKEGTLELSQNDVVLATSSASRGIDVPFRKMVAIVPSHSMAEQLAELYQAVCRIRNGKTDEREHKEIVLIAYSKKMPNRTKEENSAEVFFRSVAVERAKEMIKAFINPFEEGSEEEYLMIPLPSLSNSVFGGVVFSDYKQLIKYAEKNGFNPGTIEGSITVTVESQPFRIYYPFAFYRAKFGVKNLKVLKRLIDHLLQNKRVAPSLKKLARSLTDTETFLPETFIVAEYLPARVFKNLLQIPFYTNDKSILPDGFLISDLRYRSVDGIYLLTENTSLPNLEKFPPVPLAF